MVSSRERRALIGAGQSVPSDDEVAFSRYLGATASQLKGTLPEGWDVTLVVSRHYGDGRVSCKQASTLPPHVARATLQALAFADGPRASQPATKDEATSDEELSQPGE